ncbi:unnamed protein product [Rhodiola kirilowii]
MKAVVLALAATAFIFLVYLKVDHQLRPDPATTRRHALSRRFGFNSHHVVFDPLVANMERRAEQGGKTGGNDKTNGLASEVKGAYDYFDDEGNLNITLRIIVLFPWLDTSPKDGYVDFKELESWNTRMAMERLNYRTQREIEARDKDGDGNIGFREYLHHMTDQEIEKNGTRHGETGWWREQFENADVDRNGTLDFAEFKDFLHPEDSENEKIQKWLLREKIKRMDYDEDGRLTYSEFLERAYDTYKNYIDFESAGAHVPSPETIFAQLDVVKDGFLSVEELMPILRYLHPGELAYAKYFTSYLFHEADENRDGKLTLEEMLNHEYIFYSTVYDENQVDYGAVGLSLMDDFGKVERADVAAGDREMEGKDIHLVSSADSPEFSHLINSLNRSSLIGLDAEWKPTRRDHSSTSTASPFPTVSLLQIACLISSDSSVVFLLDLLALPLPLIYDLLEDVFQSPHILKLGFRFKQDLVYLSDTFCAQGCDPGFDRVEPFLDISTIYSYLRPGKSGRKSKDTNSLATICRELLGISLSKELQCSDWSYRPLTEEQKSYAAADARCLLDLFTIFQLQIAEGSVSISNATLRSPADSKVIEGSDLCDNFCKIKLDEASQVLFVSAHPNNHLTEWDLDGIVTKPSSLNCKPLEDSLLKIVKMYGEKILLDEASKIRKSSKRRKRQPTNSSLSKNNFSGLEEDFPRQPPWDPTLGGDGCAKFLCDVMVEGLAKHLRCVGIDAAVPINKKPEARELIDQAHKEKRVLLTRDAKLLRHEYLITGQIYRVKSLLKNDQLLEVIETFHLKIDEDRLMSRCTKCNGSFIQKPLSTEEAVEAAKGFQKIPSCLYNKDIEFWQCRDCHQLYWEGTQYHNAVQKFMDVCKLNE